MEYYLILFRDMGNAPSYYGILFDIFSWHG